MTLTSFPDLQTAKPMPSEKIYELDGVFKVTGLSSAPSVSDEGKATIIKTGTTYFCMLRWPKADSQSRKLKLSGNIRQSQLRAEKFTVILRNNFQIIGKSCNPDQVKEFIDIVNGIQAGNNPESPQGRKIIDEEKENKPLSSVSSLAGISKAILSPCISATAEKIPEGSNGFKIPTAIRSSLTPARSKFMVDSASKRASRTLLFSLDKTKLPGNSKTDLISSINDLSLLNGNSYSFWKCNATLQEKSSRLSTSQLTSKENIAALGGFSFQFSDKTEDSQDQTALVGFENLGNTCYMNAILQALLSLPSFAGDLEAAQSHPNVRLHTLIRALYYLLISKRKSNSEEKQRLILKRIKQKISGASDMFSSMSQHDAHEFLCQCFEQIKEEASGEESKLPSYEIPEPVSTQEVDNESSCGQDDKTMWCPVRKNFECEVSHTIECNGCKKAVIKEETMHNFSLNLPDTNTTDCTPFTSVGHLLSDYFEEEKVEYTCENCGNKTSTLSHTFTKLPRVITLHLKRYQYDTGILKNSKKSNKIDIPKIIDLGFLCKKETSLPPTYTNPSNECKPDPDLDDFDDPPYRPYSAPQKRPWPFSTEYGSLSKIRRRLNMSDGFICSKRQGEPSSPNDESPEPILPIKAKRALSFSPKREDEVECKDSTVSPPLNSERLGSSAESHVCDQSQKSHDAELPEVSGGRCFNNTEDPIPVENCDGTYGLKLLDEAILISEGKNMENKSLAELAEGAKELRPKNCTEEEEQIQLALEMSLLEYNGEIAEQEQELITPSILPIEGDKVSITPRRYRLVGIINHHGDSANVGHYTCDVYDHSTQEWKSCNDSAIQTVTEHEVRYGRAHTAYILFYVFDPSIDPWWHANMHVFESSYLNQALGVFTPLPCRSVSLKDETDLCTQHQKDHSC